MKFIKANEKESQAKVEWWTTGSCGMYVYKVKEAFELSDVIYIKMIVEKKANPSCNIPIWTILLELKKGTKEGVYSAPVAEGKLKID